VTAPKSRRPLSAIGRFLDPGAPRWLTIPALLVTLALLAFQATTLPALIFGEHDWRQADTFSVAFWFRHESPDFFHPRIDWGSDHSGIMGMEAPIFPYAIYLLSLLFGTEPVVGRALNWVLFWPIALLFARRFTANRASATFLLLAFATAPMGLYEFREVQPDPFMTSLLAASAILFDRSAREEGEAQGWLLAGYATATLAVLSKVPATVALPGLWVLAMRPGRLVSKRNALLAAGFLVPVAFAIVWDRWAHYLNEVYNGGQAYFHIDFSLAKMWKSLTNGDLVFGRILLRELPGYVMCWVWFPAFVCGLVCAFVPREWRRRSLAMLMWLVLALLFCACFSDRLVAHWYYSLVVFLPASYFVGKGLENVVDLVIGSRPPRLVTNGLAWTVVLAMLCTPLVGGALKEGRFVQGAGGASVAWSTWCLGAAPVWLAGILVVAFAFAALAPRGSSRNLVVAPIAGIAVAIALLRGAHDGARALEWRGRLRERAQTEQSIRSLERAADRLIPRTSKVLVDQDSPAYLRRVRRHGYALSVEAIDKKTLRSFGKRAPFLVHFGRDDPPANAPTPITAGTDWAIYCIMPGGCPLPNGGRAPGPSDEPVVRAKPRRPPAIDVPPMGWSTGSRPECDAGESVVLETADAIVAGGLRAAGYEFLIVDDCWARTRDDSGTLVADPKLFPRGVAPLVAAVHERGLKLGISTSAGERTCRDRPGSREHEAEDAQTFADWGVDLIKEDWCVAQEEKGFRPKAQFTAFYDALLEVDRPIVFGIDTGNAELPTEWAPRIATMWGAAASAPPASPFDAMVRSFHDAARNAFFVSRGHYGFAGLLGSAGRAMTDEELRAQLSLWAMAASPLLVGTDLRHVSNGTARVLTNAEVIAIDRDASALPAVNVSTDQGVELWSRPLHGAGRRAVLVVNTMASPVQREVHWTEIGLRDETAKVRDVWAHEDRGASASYAVSTPAHGVTLLTVDGSEPAPPSGAVDLGAWVSTYAIDADAPVARDHAWALPGAAPVPMSMHGERYEKGLGVHAESDVRFSLGGHCAAFSATIGIDDSSDGDGSVTFQVWGDDRKLFDSGKVTAKAKPRPVRVQLGGVNELRLVVRARGSTEGDVADWALAALECR
jgi:alpha-galactosidase